MRQRQAQRQQRRCPKCGNSIVTHVGHYLHTHYPQDAQTSWGLGFIREDGKVCCSINGSVFDTVEEAQVVADSQTLAEWCVDEENSPIDMDIGDDQDPCGDPYPDRPQF